MMINSSVPSPMYMDPGLPTERSKDTAAPEEAATMAPPTGA